jgi:hypothetical protein
MGHVLSSAFMREKHCELYADASGSPRISLCPVVDDAFGKEKICFLLVYASPKIFVPILTILAPSSIAMW